MLKRVLGAVVILPGTVLVMVPALILWATDGTEANWHWIGVAQPVFLLGAALGAAGLALAVWTVRLFVRDGDGTPAPWDPASRLIVRGPYRHVRNPMISAVFMMLAAEALLFDSWPLGVWLTIFYLVNAAYIPHFEERGLEKRFGAAYRRYKAHVPRWFPSPMAYDPEEERRLSRGERP